MALGFVCLFSLILGGTALAAKKVIHVWHTETNPKSRPAIANIVSRFEALHPDIKVEAQASASASGAFRPPPRPGIQTLRTAGPGMGLRSRRLRAHGEFPH